MGLFNTHIKLIFLRICVPVLDVRFVRRVALLFEYKITCVNLVCILCVHFVRLGSFFMLVCFRKLDNENTAMNGSQFHCTRYASLFVNCICHFSWVAGIDYLSFVALAHLLIHQQVPSVRHSRFLLPSVVVSDNKCLIAFNEIGYARES